MIAIAIDKKNMMCVTYHLRNHRINSKVARQEFILLTTWNVRLTTLNQTFISWNLTFFPAKNLFFCGD
jgi:hypothetical protein